MIVCDIIIIPMGGCCDFFQKDEIHTNESRIRLLQSKVKEMHHTENDPHFTYYLHYFDQHIYLERVLQEYRQVYQRTEDSTAYHFDNKQIEIQLQTIQKYLQDLDTIQTPLSSLVKTDLSKIDTQLSSSAQLPAQKYPCMVKLQIQGFQLVHGISRITIEKVVRVNGQERKTEENIFVNRIKHQRIYRELVFPAVKGSKIKIVTEPTESRVTIDVEDVMKNQAVCSVFRFQNGHEDFGFVALRLQFVTADIEYNNVRRERLRVLEKELKICASKEGVSRLSSSRSQSGHIHTFISDHVSEYHNEYQM